MSDKPKPEDLTKIITAEQIAADIHTNFSMSRLFVMDAKALENADKDVVKAMGKGAEIMMSAKPGDLRILAAGSALYGQMAMLRNTIRHLIAISEHGAVSWKEAQKYMQEHMQEFEPLATEVPLHPEGSYGQGGGKTPGPQDL